MVALLLPIHLTLCSDVNAYRSVGMEMAKACIWCHGDGSMLHWCQIWDVGKSVGLYHIGVRCGNGDMFISHWCQMWGWVYVTLVSDVGCR